MGSLTEKADARVREVPRGRRREGGRVAGPEIADDPRIARVDDQEIETGTETGAETGTETATTTTGVQVTEGAISMTDLAAEGTTVDLTIFAIQNIDRPAATAVRVARVAPATMTLI